MSRQEPGKAVRSGEPGKAHRYKVQVGNGQKEGGQEPVHREGAMG